MADFDHYFLKMIPNNFLVRTSSLDELLSLNLSLDSVQGNRIQVKRELLEFWCDRSHEGDWSQFSKQLGRLGLTDRLFNQQLIAPPSNDIHIEPQWFIDSCWVGEGLCQGSPLDSKLAGRVPFFEVVSGVVDKAMDILEIKLRNSVIPKINKSILDELFVELSQELSNLISPTLYSLFLKFRLERSIASLTNQHSVSSRKIYQEFIAWLKQDGLSSILNEKPVLLRLLAVTARQWLESILKVFQHLAEDLVLLQKSFGHELSFDSISKVSECLSDPHNGGLSVRVISFEDRKIVYKPRNCSLENSFFEMVCALNASNACPTMLRMPLGVHLPDHSWSEFIEFAVCTSGKEVSEFYFRSGAWLSLFHVLGGTDMHAENLIAMGQHPIPIDLEMLLQGNFANIGASEQYESILEAQSVINDSVASVGLLPVYLREDYLKSDGFGGLLPLKPIAAIHWDHIGTDAMEPRSALKEKETARNIPLSDSSELQPVLESEQVIDGFKQYSNHILRNKRIVTDFLHSIKGLNNRYTVRSTQFYTLVLAKLKDVRNMDSGLRWSLELEFLARSIDWDHATNDAVQLFAAEKRDLVELNVPYFFGTTDGTDLLHHRGEKFELLRESGLSRALRRLEMFSPEDIHFQSDVIAFQTQMTVPESASEIGPETYEILSSGAEKEDGQQTALWLSRASLDCILSTAIKKGNGASWIGLNWGGHSDAAQLSVLDSDIYNGNLGISLFLAAYHATFRDEVSRNLAIRALQPLRYATRDEGVRRWIRGVGLGGFTGAGSAIYALVLLSEMLDLPSCLDDALRIASNITQEIISSDKDLDLITGAAGCAIALIRLHEKTGDFHSIRAAILCADHILSQPKSINSSGKGWSSFHFKNQALSGISHGAAGFALAFDLIAQVTGRSDHLLAAHDCLQYENSLFDVLAGNWADLRVSGELTSKYSSCQWCHGAGGIGQARLGMLRSSSQYNIDIHRDKLFLDLERSLATVAAKGRRGLDSLCCGDIGNINLLIEAATLLNRPDLRSQAERWLAQIVTSRQSRGHFRWLTGDDRVNISLFRGMAGLGYTALRFLNSELPSILSMGASTHRPTAKETLHNSP